MTTAAIPATIGPFRIRQLLGSGGFGHVYAAVDPDLGRWVAIKALRPEIGGNKTLVERLRAEGVSLARLNHPNITTLYALQRDRRDLLFLVMELVKGRTLEDVLGQLGRLGVVETLAVVAQIAAGLGYAHRMGVIHRDIKPANLMLTDAGVVKIMDFGIARIRGTQRLTRAGLLGTYAYLAPEQFGRAEGSERSDLYSLACMVYEMLSGRIPFDAGSEAEIMRGHLELAPRPLRTWLPGLDPRIEAAVSRALAKNPAGRFPGVEAFSEALGAATLQQQAAEIVRQRIVAMLPAVSRPAVMAGATVSVATAAEPARAMESLRQALRDTGLRLPRAALLAGGALACLLAMAGVAVWELGGTGPTGVDASVVPSPDGPAAPWADPGAGAVLPFVPTIPVEARPVTGVFPPLPGGGGGTETSSVQPVALSRLATGSLSATTVSDEAWALRGAAERGEPGAMYALGLSYRGGHGVPQDPTTATEWFRRAAEHDHAAAMSQLAELYLAGDGVPASDTEARNWFEKAAAREDPAGMYGLGYMHEEGRGGLAKNEVAAVDWYRRAVAAGEPGAMVTLGRRYRIGRGVPKDYAQARTLYQQAADKGVPGAYIGLGLLYRDGQGVPCDLDMARHWFQKAADGGNPQEREQALRGLAQLSGRSCTR
ncbi:Non-specific serine/threonine protein kinase [Rhodovastum atsumiense]|uniref:Protein kinase n=1 Tax=Rhodovastum atsumiense TaxID=504468 RepID=A0A5M6ISD8_9PROT|nr:serine/threonine-protein kinase [Rhodovastum atsumiense]KAA5611226.1 protein kinase [Rhodovastum atsumiense]CAH2602461.1 Non-specific serine/threonine protein kinase [Rhodovastum atsumiense]